MISKIFWIVLIIFNFKFLHSQTLMPKIAPSPNATALGEYGVVPIDHYVGVISPKIDVFEYDLNGYKLNINFSYRNAGTRYSQESSNIGLGWVLNAGGVITKAQNSGNDFANNGYSNTEQGNIKVGETDLEPDIFYYNFNGISGKFIMPKIYVPEGKILNQSEELSIRYLSNNTFLIKDSKGVEYNFAKTETTTVKYSTNDSEAVYTSSWYLSTIKLLNQQEIKFMYTTAQLINQNKTSVGVANYRVQTNAPCFQQPPAPQSLSSNVVVYNDEVLLTEIYASNLQVNFSYNDRSDLKTKSGVLAKKLSSFTISNGQNNVIKQVNLDHTYFSSSSNQNFLSKRLKLDKVKINDQEYTFEYQEQGIPDKNSQDYKGFSFIENSPEAGLLKKMTYPTKGYSKFFYEQNNYSAKHQYSEDVQSVGLGVRISSIENYDHNSPGLNDILLSKKIYEYNKATLSAGRLVTAMRTAVQYNEPTTFKCIVGGKEVIYSGNYIVDAFYKENMMPLGGNDVIVGYDKVTIRNVVGNIDNGKEEYIFKNNITEYPTMMPGCMGNIDFSNGTLLSKTSFKNEKQKYVAVSKDSMTYQLINNGQYIGKVPLTLRFIGEYSLTVNKSLLISKISYEYNSMLPDLLNKTDYTYINDRILVKEETSLNSMGKTVKKKFKYPFEYGSSPHNIYSTMTSLNMLDIPIETVTSVNGNIVSADLISYKQFSPNIIRESNLYSLNINQPLVANGFVESSINSNGELNLDNNYLLKQQVLACDEYGNVTVIKSPKSSEKNIIWAYNGHYPIIDVENADNDKFNESIIEEYDGLNLSLPGEASRTFTVGASGTITLQFNSGAFLSTGATYNVNYWITGPQNYNGYFCRNNTPGTGCYNNPDLYRKQFNNMPPGVYTVRVQSSNSNPNSIAYVSLSYPKKIYQIVAGKEFFYEGFENDNTASSSGVLIGSKFHLGAFTVPFVTPTTKKFIIDYKYRLAGKWISISKPYINNMTLSDGDAVDEVRVYPVGAKMTTYTYKPLVGMTSKTDSKGMSEIYEYDLQGRLSQIKDNRGNITKTFNYNFKSN